MLLPQQQDEVAAPEQFSQHVHPSQPQPGQQQQPQSLLALVGAGAWVVVSLTS